MTWGYDGPWGYGATAPPPAVPAPGMSVICAVCWEQWLRAGTRWLSEPVAIVTVHEGRAMCEKHFRAAVGLT